ncbi:MAG TPA: FAD-dependent oxidoreductase, partial [Acidobacteriaceae bacterium]|nr:FAD-dependent oxidoreductase [Acidobacteriaceae bacterium]
MAAGAHDVLLIGAGMAGLAAANSLASSGLRVLLLEAQHHIGGRVLTRRIGDQVIELGAEFVHGRPPELWSLIEEAGLAVREREGTRLSFHDGALHTDGEIDDTFEPLADLKNFDGPDLSFAEYLNRKPLPPEQRGALIGYIEGFNAADHRQISTASLAVQQQAEDAVDGDRLYHVVGGYDQLAHYLAGRITARRGSIRLGERAREIRWRSGRVTVLTGNDSFTAPQAVIAVP